MRLDPSQSVLPLQSNLCALTARRHPFDVLAIGALIIISLAMNVVPRDLCSPILIALALAVLPFYRTTRKFWATVWPLCGILVLGAPGFVGHEFRDVIRDIFFALTPLALIFIGFWLAQRKGFWNQVPASFVGLGVVFALAHLSAFFFTPSLLLADSMVVRAATGGASDVTVLGLLVLLFINRFTPGYRPLRGAAYGLIFAILGASVVLSYSRTTMVVLLLGATAALGWWSGRNLKWPLLILSVGLVGLLLAGADGSAGEELTFMSKLTRSLAEVAVSNYETYADISMNWRGFENFKTLEQYLAGDVLQLLVGQGYGALVDLGFYMALGGDASIDFRYIPVLHNGYGYVLLKYGAIGIILYITFYAKLILLVAGLQRSPVPQTAFCARLLLGLTLALGFMMFVVGGMAQLANSEFVVLMGALVAKLQAGRQWPARSSASHRALRQAPTSDA